MGSKSTSLVKGFAFTALLAGFNELLPHLLNLLSDGFQYKDVLGATIFFLSGVVLYLKGKYEEKPETK